MQVTVDLTGRRGAVRCAPRWSLSVLEAARECPGRSRFLEDTFWFERSDENDDFFRNTFPVRVSGEVKVLGSEEDSSEFLVGGRPPFRTPYKPDDQQAVALTMAAKNPLTFAFFEKPGFGKTKVALDHCVKLWCDGVIDAILVLSLNFVHEQWILDEIPKHVHNSIPVKASVFYSHAKIDRDFFRRDETTLRILAMNYEAYNSKRGAAALANFQNSGRVAAILDESHTIKTPHATITQSLWSDRKRYAARFLLTGGPTPLGLQDYYAQFRFLNPNIIGARNYVGFKSRYCRMGGFQNTQVVGYQNADELHRRMAPYVHVGEPVIEAEQIATDFRFNLSKPVRDAYDQFAEDLVMMADSGEMITARSQLSAITKLQQIACGRILDEEGNVLSVHDERLGVLKSVLKAREGQKAIIWSRFRADIEAQKQMLGKNCVAINGDTPKDRRRDLLQRFKDDEVQYVVGSPAAMGTGLNLQNTCHLNIFYSNSDNAQQRWQAEARTYRRGTERDVENVDIIARGTVDSAIVRRYRNKVDMAQLSVNEFKNLIFGE